MFILKINVIFYFLRLVDLIYSIMVLLRVINYLNYVILLLLITIELIREFNDKIDHRFILQYGIIVDLDRILKLIVIMIRQD